MSNIINIPEFEVSEFNRAFKEIIETNFNWQEIFTLREEFIKYGVWLKPFSGLIYIMPSFTITKKELIIIIKAIDNIFHL